MSTSHQRHVRALDETYHRGYHHGVSQAFDLVFGLLDSGLPRHALEELCEVYEQEVVIPWRAKGGELGTAPPRFDLAEYQRLLRLRKEHQSEEDSQKHW